jgi:ATP-dependent RNA helicase RhlE
VEIIDQSVYFVDKGNKTKLLSHLIREKGMDSVLVFSRTKHGANRIAQDLGKQGITAAAIHGNKSQTARQQALADFKAGRLTALVATDIAARGIDIDELKWVVNYDLPEVPETYVHRIGRTGRAGREGTALSFCRADERDYLKGIEKLLGRKLPVVDGHPYPMVEAATGVDPMVQARREGKENARLRAAERRQAQGAKAKEVHAPKLVQGEKPPREIPAEKKAAPKRGVRQQRLEDTIPAQPARASGDFVRPDPLASDRIMDATARLLAPRPRPAKQSDRPRQEGSGQSRRRDPQPAKAAGQKKEPTVPQGARSKQNRGGGAAGKAQNGTIPGGRARSRRNDRPRPVELKHSHVKDSTEQPSLMKPYYLHDDD